MVYYPGKFHPGRWKITRPRFVHPSPLGPTEGGQNTHRLFHPDGWNFTPSGFLHLRGLEGGIIPTKLFHPHHLTTPHLDPHLTSPHPSPNGWNITHLNFPPVSPHLTSSGGNYTGWFFDWSPLKCLSMELVLAPQFRTGPPPTHNVIKFVKELQYNT